ncbi:glycosyltransferase family 2 protein [Prosthecobacter sp.]|uniref:glycosyltransferase family 2 protein n=1 Tax=Prosthecobacter sp. TaxID=1965333 RepID=UPI001E17C7DD|nr:glycosyltransferase family 2 protein [Prosthecobacter sp.]MCB1276303.1 glycosyltransferase family 2 protein [Prosthecobacter sp.]
MKLQILIPSYNTGRLLADTVLHALEHWSDVCVVLDGSTDGSEKAVEVMQPSHPGLRLIKQPCNCGKGAAVLRGAEAAKAAGFTHVLTMDADGQHPAEWIPKFVQLAEAHPQAVLFGKPVFGPEAPQLRVQGRRISNGWANLETLGWGIGDSLFGMRVYPVQALLDAFRSTWFARRFDFDTEVAVRVCWLGVPTINVPTPVRYLTQAEGGVSQFRYVRDNALLTWMHARLMISFMLRLPFLLWRALRGGNPLKNIVVD